MHLLDADTLTHLHARHPRVVERLSRCNDPEVGISIITKAEVLRARCDYLLKAADGEHVLRAQSWLEVSEALFRQLIVVPYDVAAIRELTRLQNHKTAKTIGRADLFVASVALANRATLVTRNLRHFRQVPGLDLENWVD